MPSNRIVDHTFVNHVSRFLDESDDIKLFSEGCCFHFALRLFYDRGIPIIDGCVDQTPRAKQRLPAFHHVWLAIDAFAVDVTGVHDRGNFNRAMENRYSGSISGIEANLVQAKIDEKILSPSVSKQVNDRALWIFDNESRFELIRRLLG
jgi:hypothetical protein